MTTRGPQAKGVGKNSKRHDLERPTGPPPQHGSDLQQGDTQMLNQGLQQAPVGARPTQQPVATSKGQARQQQPQGETPIMDVVGNRLGGTINTTPNAPARSVDKRLKNRGESWLQFLQSLSSQPGASPLLKASVQDQLVRQIRANSQQTRGGAIFMRDADDALEAL